MMAGMLAALVLFAQDPFQSEIDEALSRFESAQEADQALALLSSQLLALGAGASDPIARRLALDLRDGMASSAAPALIDALMGRPGALAPLQSAFQDAGTSAGGRIELAEALLHLDDTMSWRGGLLAIASDDRVPLADRLHASRVLLDAEDPQIAEILRSLADRLPGAERRQVADFLQSRGMLAGLGTDEPRVRIIDEAPRPSASATRLPSKKKETRTETFFTMPSILAGGVTLVLLVLLAVEILRKG